MSMIASIVERIAGRCGRNSLMVFSDFLDYFIHGFNPSGEPMKKWDYDHGSNKMFYDCCMELTGEYGKGVATKGWCDPLGDLFMQLMGKSDTQRNGVFFTPEGICKLMAQISVDGKDLAESERTDCGAFGFRTMVSDPTCGSGRNLLAVASKFADRPRAELPFFVGEDVDGVCCKMAAVNLMCHGLPGEVICHNTLSEPDSCKFGLVVNEGMFPFAGGLPTIRVFSDPMRFVTLRRAKRPTAPKC